MNRNNEQDRPAENEYQVPGVTIYTQRNRREKDSDYANAYAVSKVRWFCQFCSEHKFYNEKEIPLKLSLSIYSYCK